MRATRWIVLGISAVLAACSTQQPTIADQAQPAVPPSSATASGAATGSTAQGSGAVAASNSGGRVAAPSERSVYFEFDSSTLPPGAAALLQAHAGYITGNPAPLRIEGNADKRGSREYNLALGQRRADVVRQGLILNGVRGDAVESISYSEERPRCSERTEQCFAGNRRADIVSGR